MKKFNCHEENSILRLLIKNKSDLRLTFYVLVEGNRAAQFGNSLYARQSGTYDLPYTALTEPGRKNDFQALIMPATSHPGCSRKRS